MTAPHIRRCVQCERWFPKEQCRDVILGNPNYEDVKGSVCEEDFKLLFPDVISSEIKIGVITPPTGS